MILTINYELMLPNITLYYLYCLGVTVMEMMDKCNKNGKCGREKGQIFMLKETKKEMGGERFEFDNLISIIKD